jgi:hypothetical protein
MIPLLAAFGFFTNSSQTVKIFVTRHMQSQKSRVVSEVRVTRSIAATGRGGLAGRTVRRARIQRADATNAIRSPGFALRGSAAAIEFVQRSVARGAPRSGDRAAAGMSDRAKNCWGAYSPLRDRIFLRKKLLRPSRSIRIVAFRASHPAKLPARQRRFVQRFPSLRASIRLRNTLITSR